MTAASTATADLRGAREALKADTRAAILSAAASILSDEGPAALTVRRVAEAVNASTKVIYTSFGGKDGLLDALYLHSFAGLERALAGQRAVEPPLARLHATADAYRAYARSEPALYGVMFGDGGRAYDAPIASRRQAWETFRILREAIVAALPVRTAEEADRATRHLWSAMHGVVSLELRGLLGDAAACKAILGAAIESVYRTHGLPAG